MQKKNAIQEMEENTESHVKQNDICELEWARLEHGPEKQPHREVLHIVL